MKVNGRHYRTVWMEGSIVKTINQPLLPHRFEIIDLPRHTDSAVAIREMIVRGAGAIGSMAAYAMAQASMEAPDDPADFASYMEKAAETVKATRPTAVDLFHAVDQVMSAAAKDFRRAKEACRTAARNYSDVNAAAGEEIGRLGAELIADEMKILTHCNAGWLAFADWGSALAPIYAAKRQGRHVFVFVDETRPRCQGSRLTAWELGQESIDHAVIADNAAGHYMKKGDIDMVIVGSDRIAANGDVANKIGTYEKAVCAKENGIPFYVAAPVTTIDPDCPSGDDIPIEERPDEEVVFMWGRTDDGDIARVRIAPESSPGRNPAFDVTPARYVTGIITENGIFRPSLITDALKK